MTLDVNERGMHDSSFPPDLLSFGIEDTSLNVGLVSTKVMLHLNGILKL